MALTYSPKTYAGAHFQEIFSEILFNNKTIDKNLVRFLDNIKDEVIVTTISGDMPVQDYKTMVTSADAASTINFGDAKIAPVKKMVYDEFDPNTLLATRFSKGMKSGAANLESDEFLSNVLAYAEQKISNGMESHFWAGIVSKLNVTGATAPVKVTGVALTASNVAAEFAKVYNAIPAELLDSNEVVIFADRSIKKHIKVANLNAAYRDIFGVSGEEIDYLGIKVEFVPLGANKMVAGKATDLVWATDLLSDMGQLEVNRLQNNSDKMFIKAVFTIDSAVVVPSQKVLYTV